MPRPPVSGVRPRAARWVAQSAEAAAIRFRRRLGGAHAQFLHQRHEAARHSARPLPRVRRAAFRRREPLSGGAAQERRLRRRPARAATPSSTAHTASRSPALPARSRRPAIGGVMTTRREHLKALAALGCLPVSARAQSEADIPPQGIGNRIRHVSYSDQGGRPDAVQVMVNRRHVYVGHMFNRGVTILDATDPRHLKPVNYWSLGEGDFTRTHQLQIANDTMLLANGANIVAMQSYDNQRGYFENNLADSITSKKKFRSGLSIHDVAKPGEMREIAFLEMPGFGINRTHWTGGRYAYVSAHFDGFTDHILCVVDLKQITKPEIISRWWLPGMNRGAGETPTLEPGRRVALHHMLTANSGPNVLGFGAWRDGGLTIHD